MEAYIIALIKRQELSPSEREKYLELLLLADEDEWMVRSYFRKGWMFRFTVEDETIGVAHCIPINETTVELKNIAVVLQCRGKGLGKLMVQNLLHWAQDKGFCVMEVGTANSSIDNIAFYQKCGFRMKEIKRDFFRAYSKPNVEFGIQALDMVMFSYDLKHEKVNNFDYIRQKK